MWNRVHRSRNRDLLTVVCSRVTYNVGTVVVSTVSQVGTVPETKHRVCLVSLKHRNAVVYIKDKYRPPLILSTLDRNSDQYNHGGTRL